MGMLSHDALEQFGAPRAHEAVDADNLASPQGQRHVIDNELSRPAHQADVLAAKHFVAEVMIDRLGKVL